MVDRSAQIKTGAGSGEGGLGGNPVATGPGIKPIIAHAQECAKDPVGEIGPIGGHTKRVKVIAHGYFNL